MLHFLNSSFLVPDKLKNFIQLADYFLFISSPFEEFVQNVIDLADRFRVNETTASKADLPCVLHDVGAASALRFDLTHWLLSRCDATQKDKYESNALHFVRLSFQPSVMGSSGLFVIG
jgi:hypothetical protein